MEPSYISTSGASNIFAMPIKDNNDGCTVENCTFNRDVLTVMGTAISLAVKLSKKHVINITCSVDALKGCSEFYKGCSNHSNFLENQKETPLNVDLSENNLNLKLEHLQFIADYINNGEFNETDQWSLEELKGVYVIAHYLGMEEMVIHLSEKIQPKYYYDTLDCFCFGIKYSSAKIIGKTLPNIVGDFWKAAENKKKPDQYLRLRKTLIIKAAEINGKHTNILKVMNFMPEGLNRNPNNLNRDGDFLYPLEYVIPSDILEIFPEANEVDFDGVHGNIITNDANVKVLVRRPEDCQTIYKYETQYRYY